ncbi:MAG: M3 family metallopeptidase [Bacteroidales bacterium]|nr:M3 family metallopeptidase [Bacteroidales bacterium]
MKKLIVALSAALVMVSCTNPFYGEWDTPYGIPPFDKIKDCHYLPAVKKGIELQRAEIDAIVSNPEAPTFENTVAAFDRSGEVLSRVANVLFNVSESDASERINAIVAQAMPLVSEFQSSIMMDKALYERVKTVYENEYDALGREQQMLLKDLYDGFEKSGIGLPEEQQRRIKEIDSELASLALVFGNNLLAESNAYKAQFGRSVANFYDDMASESDRARREAMFKAYSSRGNNSNANDNKSTVLRIMQLRIEKAKILGYANPAEMILEDKMAHDPATVDAFLANIMKAAVKCAKKDIVDLQAMMDADAASGNVAPGEKLQPWDYLYYAEKLRKARYDLDEAEVMQYFKMENVRAGVFGNASRLYGISFEPIEGVALYNPEAEAFKVLDADGSLLGIIITDYYPRDTKRAGAWMTNFVEQYIDPVRGEIRPVIVNVGNFNKPTADQPSLLTIDQVQTMFHEFGHALHGLLTKCAYKGTSGTNVKRDFVELPSQINENWALQPEVLATYAFHYETGEVIPADLVAKVQAAANFGQGFSTTELCAASILDMKWHELSEVPADLEEFEKSVCSQMGLPQEIIPRYRSTYFNHIFGSSGYSAGYYSYLWAEVLDKDAFELFKLKGIFDSQTAMSFRRNVLEKGGSEEPMTLYKQFRGADPDAGALLRARGLDK